MQIELDEIFATGGALDQCLEGYEFRPSQLAMAESVLRAIVDREHLCVEAGTGTGKSLAYLVPALAVEGRVVVSTATRNLQEQLLSRDIPLIRRVLKPSLAVVCLKGRSNYLCLLRLDRATKQGRLFPEDSSGKGLTSLEEWSKDTETGDRAELEWLSDTSEMWESLDARSDICLGSKCPYFKDCFITRLRRRSLEADIIIVNHALFFTNLSMVNDDFGGLLPAHEMAVLDEAHEIEDIASGFFGKRFSTSQLDHLVRDIASGHSSNPDLAAVGNRLAEAGTALRNAFPALKGRYSLNLFQDRDGVVSDLRRVLYQELDRVESCLVELYHHLESGIDAGPEYEILGRRVDGLLGIFDEIVHSDDENAVYWVEQGRRGVGLNLTPVNVAPALREKLFAEIPTVVLTSATLKTGGNFTFFKERLGLDESLEVGLPGEFDYSVQARLFVPADLPDPSSESNFELQMGYIKRILEITEGHAFLLFTSFRQMKRAHEMLRREDDYPLLLQGEKPKSVILDQFRKTPHSVLCATGSFWQGVDVRGRALQAVVIDRLPFQVPTDPVVSARFRQMKMKGQDPFRDYAVPSAVIALRQGLGRLVRSGEDRGIMAVLDSRLWNKWYGKYFLESLSSIPVTDRLGDLEDFWHLSS